VPLEPQPHTPLHSKTACARQVVAIAAAKCDCAPAARRVAEREGRAWAAARGLPYFEVSALTGAGVGALFAALFVAVLAAAPAAPQDAVCRAADAAHAAAGGVAESVAAADQEGGTRAMCGDDTGTRLARLPEPPVERCSGAGGAPATAAAAAGGSSPAWCQAVVAVEAP
jgi:hypothetical protein